jgi:hypothetical protein
MMSRMATPGSLQGAQPSPYLSRWQSSAQVASHSLDHPPAPRWVRQWLDPGAKDCIVHELPLIDVPIGVIRKCRNFDYVLRMASRQARHREMHARNLRDLVAGGFCMLTNRISRRR